MSQFLLDHIGIAVESIEKGAEFYRHLGIDKIETEEVASEGVRVAFVPMKNQANIELLEPLEENSPVGKFLKKRGPGIHHICLRVENLEQILSNLKDKGVRLINEKPRPGAHQCRVAFIHPSSAGGVLVELSEKVE